MLPNAVRFVWRQPECGMATTVKVEFTVPAEVRGPGDGGAYYISVCPPLDVYSQGETENIALANLAEALRLFIESCFERGTLEEVLDGRGSVSDQLR